MIVRKAEQQIAKRLAPVAGEDALLEATFLLRASGFHSPYQELSETDAKALEPLIERRLSGEPLQYVLGEWEFYGLPFYVNESVLIPRPDTERLVETALRLLSKDRRDVLDLCCGSGCIGIALAALGGANVTAADLSADALELAERNARRNGVSLTTVQSDLFEAVEGTFDLSHRIRRICPKRRWTRATGVCASSPRLRCTAVRTGWIFIAGLPQTIKDI